MKKNYIKKKNVINKSYIRNAKSYIKNNFKKFLKYQEDKIKTFIREKIKKTFLIYIQINAKFFIN